MDGRLPKQIALVTAGPGFALHVYEQAALAASFAVGWLWSALIFCPAVTLLAWLAVRWYRSRAVPAR
jgi:hypothetical protein